MWDLSLFLFLIFLIFLTYEYDFKKRNECGL